MIISDNHKKSTIIIPFSNSFQKNLGSNWQMVREKNACSFSHQPALPSSSKTVAYPSRAGDSTLLKISLIHLMTDHPPGPTALLTKFLKLYRNIVVAKWGVEPLILPTDWAPALYILPLPSYLFLLTSSFLPLPSYLLPLTSYIFVVQLLRGRY